MAEANNASAGSGRKDAIVRWSVLIVGILVAIGMTYLSGRKQGIKLADKERAEKRAALGEAGILQDKLNARERLIRQLEARRQLHLALMAMDQRNFGIAQQNLSAAAILLGNVKGPDAPPDLAALAQDIRKVSLVAATDFAAQRQQILGFIERLDKALPNFMEPGGDDAHGGLPSGDSAKPFHAAPTMEGTVPPAAP